MLPLILLNLRKIWIHLTTERNAYAITIILFFCSIIISLYFGSYLKFGQPLLIGMTVARKYLLISIYFFMVAVFSHKKDCYRSMKYLAWLGGIISLLSMTDVALGGGVVFSQYHALGQERAGLIRIHVGTFLIVFSVVYSFFSYHNISKFGYTRIFYLILISTGLFTLLFIAMTRAVLLGLFITFSFWLKYKFNNRTLIFICSIISIAGILIVSGIGEKIFADTALQTMFKDTTIEMASDEGNVAIRKECFRYYFNLTVDNSPITGIGLFSNTNFPINPITLAETNYYYYVSDINGISTFVHFGIIGLLLVVYLSIKSIRDTKSSILHLFHHERYHLNIIYFIFIYILATPTLNNLLVESLAIYSGIFFYIISFTNPLTDKKFQKYSY